VVQEGKETEFKLQQKIADTILKRLKYFVKVVEGDIGKNTAVDSLIKAMTSILDLHLKRIDKYISSFSVLDYKETIEGDEKTQQDYQSEEIEIDNLLYKNFTNINDEIKKLNLEKENEESVLELHGGIKAPLSMREEIEKHFPDVKRLVEGMKLDFTTPPKNEMLIH